jgi:hypothetical protein
MGLPCAHILKVYGVTMKCIDCDITDGFWKLEETTSEMPVGGGMNVDSDEVDNGNEVSQEYDAEPVYYDNNWEEAIYLKGNHENATVWESVTQAAVALAKIALTSNEAFLAVMMGIEALVKSLTQRFSNVHKVGAPACKRKQGQVEKIQKKFKK